MKRWLEGMGWGGLASGLLLLNGCAFLKPPPLTPPDPAITSATPPVRATDIFDENEGVTHWAATALNGANDPKNPSPKPDKFEVTKVDSGEFIWIRSVKTVAAAPATKPAAPPPAAKGKAAAPAPVATPVMVKTYGVPEEVHLAGVVTPQAGQPGWADTVNKVKEWTMNAVPGSTVIPEVDVEQDPVFPQDVNHLPFVQIWFQGTTGKVKGKTLNLARMLVHTGYAVADINSPTSLDVKPWFNDEQFARSYIDPKTNKLAPLGLWGKGIILAQRISPPIPKGTKVIVQNVAQTKPDTKGAKSTGGHITVTKTKRVTTTTTTSQGGGVATGSPAAGASSPASSPATSSAGNKASP